MRISKMFVVGLLLSALMTTPVKAVVSHGGGLDSDGGHNCYVASCAGTYHCHQARGPRCGGGGSYSSGGSDFNYSEVYQLPAIRVAACVNLSGGSFTNSEVARMQKALKTSGYRPGPIDGVYGKQTRSALNKFEKKKNLNLSRGGSVYVESIRRLGIGC